MSAERPLINLPPNWKSEHWQIGGFTCLGELSRDGKGYAVTRYNSAVIQILDDSDRTK